MPRPGPRPSHSREQIVDCALRLMDREGPEALTFRAVARELDIAAGALSRYFANLADLQDEVAAKVMSGLRALEVRSRRDVRKELARMGMDVLRLTEAHPYLVRIQGPASAAVIARVSARSIEALREVGIDLERALMLLSIVMNLAYAWGTRDAIRRPPEAQARIAAAAAAGFGDLLQEVARIPAYSDPGARHQKWFLHCIDGLLK